MERRRVTAPGIPCAKSVRVIEAFLPLPASTPQSWSETLDLLPKLYWKQRPWADLNANACKVLQRLEGRINSARHSSLYSPNLSNVSDPGIPVRQPYKFALACF